MPSVPENVWEFDNDALKGLTIEPLKSPLSNGCMARLFFNGRNIGFVTYETGSEEYFVTPVYDIDDQTPAEGYTYGSTGCKTLTGGILVSFQRVINKLLFDSGVLMGKSKHFEDILGQMTGEPPMEK